MTRKRYEYQTISRGSEGRTLRDSVLTEYGLAGWRIISSKWNDETEPTQVLMERELDEESRKS